MSHWKIGVKILCSKSWEGQNSMKAKIWGSRFYFFLVEPLVKILCSLKGGVKILYFFPVPWKGGVKTAEPSNQLHWRGAYLSASYMHALLGRAQGWLPSRGYPWRWPRITSQMCTHGRLACNWKTDSHGQWSRAWERSYYSYRRHTTSNFVLAIPLNSWYGSIVL